MRISKSWRWLGLLAAGLAVLCMLSLYQPTTAAPREDQPTFANAAEQRLEIIRLLRESNTLLKEQNELLRSGKLRVTVEAEKQ
jgi:hypothetical protein